LGRAAAGPAVFEVRADAHVVDEAWSKAGQANTARHTYTAIQKTVGMCLKENAAELLCASVSLGAGVAGEPRLRPADIVKVCLKVSQAFPHVKEGFEYSNFREFGRPMVNGLGVRRLH